MIPDPSWSDAIFYGVECQDYGYPGTSPDEKAEIIWTPAARSNNSLPRLNVYGAALAYWPNASSNLTRPDYLVAEGIPTLVLGATADPATPISHGINVYQHLADGYLIKQQGGPHVIFGCGNECPDALVTDFLINDIIPAQRKTVCEGFIADDYVPIGRQCQCVRNPLKALSSAETEISYLPEYYYWEGFEPTSTGCTYRRRV